MGGGHLRKVLTIGLLGGKFWCLDGWSITRVSYHRALCGKILVFWIGGRGSLMGGGRLRALQALSRKILVFG